MPNDWPNFPQRVAYFSQYQMIERVAKAKWAHRQKVARRAGITPPLDDWDDELESLREEVRAETRAAIEAMREPTEAMVNAADETGKGGGVGDEGGIEPVIYDLDEVWEAMIDAALSTPDPK